VRTAAHDRDRRFAVLVSGPERTRADRLPLDGLKMTFVVLACFNLVITSLLFVDADVADTSKVVLILLLTLILILIRILIRILILILILKVVGEGGSPGIFEAVSNVRRNVETTNFAFTVIMLIVGSLGVVLESALCVSAYCLGVVLNFLLGTYALPYFVYTARYVLDIAMLYIGLVIRSRIVFTFLPIGP
jgi:hypothetical protein